MTRTKMLFTAAILAATSSMALAQGAMPPAGAPAAGAPAGGGRMAACRDDMAKFCADKTGPDRRQCMTDNKDKLSDGCKAAMAAPRPAAPGQ